MLTSRKQWQLAKMWNDIKYHVFFATFLFFKMQMMTKLFLEIFLHLYGTRCWVALIFIRGRVTASRSWRLSCFWPIEPHTGAKRESHSSRSHLKILSYSSAVAVISDSYCISLLFSHIILCVINELSSKRESSLYNQTANHLFDLLCSEVYLPYKTVFIYFFLDIKDN